MIESLKGFPPKVLAFACKDYVTKHDYETVMIPALNEALKQKGKVRLYYQIDSDFAGITSGAIWDDFKIGVEHYFRWDRIAVVTDVEWIGHTAGFFNFLIAAAVKIFPLGRTAQAREWIAEGLFQ